MKLKKWVRILLTLILGAICVKLYFASNDFAVEGRTNVSIVCWLFIVLGCPSIITIIWE